MYHQFWCFTKSLLKLIRYLCQITYFSTIPRPVNVHPINGPSGQSMAAEYWVSKENPIWLIQDHPFNFFLKTPNFPDIGSGVPRYLFTKPSHLFLNNTVGKQLTVNKKEGTYLLNKSTWSTFSTQHKGGTRISAISVKYLESHGLHVINAKFSGNRSQVFITWISKLSFKNISMISF